MRADHAPGEGAAHTPPVAAQRILIVGAGGFGREVLLWAKDTWPDQAGQIAGFLATDDPASNSRPSRLPILASPLSYEPEPEDLLLLAIGIPRTRRAVAESLLSKGARFLTLVHPTAILAPSATIGIGSIVCPFSVVSDAARIGRFALLNYHSSLGHDASVGDYAVLSPYAALGGNACVEDDVFMGIHATVGPGRRIGARSKVSPNSCALSDAPPDSIIFGAPGRVAPLIT